MSAEIQQQELTQQQPSSVAEVNTAVAEFDRVAAGIGALKQQYAGVVFDVNTTAGMKAACEARAAIRAPRYEVEKVRKAVKAPLLKLGKDIDARAAEITEQLLALESPVDTQIKNREQQIEVERKAKAEAEARRVAAINADIENDLRCVPTAMVGRSAADLDTTILDIVAIEITVQRFAEFTALASAVKASTLSKLREMHTRQLAHEAEQERLRLERLELDRQRAEQEEANRLERERIAQEETAARLQREAVEAEAKRQREAEQAEQEKRQRRERELTQLRNKRIAYINGLVLVATTGRANRKPGTRDCITETLAEAKAMLITEAEFGDLFESAVAARDAAVQQIEHILQRSDEREADRLRREQEERDRQAEVERQRAEQKRIDELRAELEPQQAGHSAQYPLESSADADVVLEMPALMTAAEIESIVAEHPDAATEAAEFQPTADDLIGLVSAEYGVGPDLAAKWLRDAFAPVGAA